MKALVARRRRLLAAVLAGTAALMAALAGGAALLAAKSTADAERAARATLDRVGRAADGLINGQFVQIDRALASIPGLLSSAGSTRPGPEASRLLELLSFQSTLYRDLLIVGPEGQVWAAARPSSRRGPFPLTHLSDDASPGAAQLQGPLKNPLTGEWSMYLARRIAIPDLPGAFAVAEAPLAMITGPLANFGEAPGLRFELRDRNGRLAASSPHLEARIGLPARQDGEAPWEWTGHSLYGGYALAAVMDPVLALQEASSDNRQLLFCAVLGEVLLLILGLVLMMGLRREARLAGQLREAIEAMSDGFVMWDPDDRLVICNQNYKDLYAESAEFLVPGATFEEIMRKGAEVGQYPQAGEDIEAFVQHMVAWRKSSQGNYERLLPNGRWVLATERRTATGGSVGMRKDVTELKKQQELVLAYKEELQALAVRFERSVKAGAARVKTAASTAEKDANVMAEAAAQAMAQAQVVRTSASGTSSTVDVVASGAELLSSSIQDVAGRARRAARLADLASERSRAATAVMAALDLSASRVSAVVDMISQLAAQTNLLALNATIESARAGEAGRGFAVVANEVKALAAQTSRSTDTIAQQVEAIQKASAQAAGSIADIDAIIIDMKAEAEQVEAAVSEQDHAAVSITTHIRAAAANTSSVSGAVAMIADRSELINGSLDDLKSMIQRLSEEASSLAHETDHFMKRVQA